MKILLCEDDEIYVESVVFMFELFEPDDTVLTAESLADAITLIEESADIDCIVLDLSLPDAKDMHALIALSRAAPDIPIMVLTAWPTWRNECLEIGAKAYAVKTNIRGETLVRLVHAVAEGTYHES